MAEHFIRGADTCPACGAQWSYEDAGRKLSRLVGVYDVGVDRVVEWLCPDCGRRWPRGAHTADPGLPADE